MDRQRWAGRAARLLEGEAGGGPRAAGAAHRSSPPLAPELPRCDRAQAAASGTPGTGSRRWAKREGATLFMTLLAAYTALLARYSGQDDIVVASPIANRNRAELEGLIGFLANTIALRTTLEDDPTFTELLRRVRETSLDALLKPGRSVRQARRGAQPRAPPWAQPDRSGHVRGAAAGSQPSRPCSDCRPSGSCMARQRPSSISRCSPAPRRTGLLVSLEYATDLFDETTAQRMLDHLATLLEAAVTDPDRAVSTLPLLTAPEREQILSRVQRHQRPLRAWLRARDGRRAGTPDARTPRRSPSATRS